VGSQGRCYLVFCMWYLFRMFVVGLGKKVHTATYFGAERGRGLDAKEKRQTHEKSSVLLPFDFKSNRVSQEREKGEKRPIKPGGNGGNEFPNFSQKKEETRSRQDKKNLVQGGGSGGRTRPIGKERKNRA